MRNIVTWAVVIAAAVGFKFFNKSSDAEDIRLLVDTLCVEEAACLETVDANFDHCFEDNYLMGGRRTSASLDIEGVMSCITEGGEDYFAFEEGDYEEGEYYD